MSIVEIFYAGIELRVKNESTDEIFVSSTLLYIKVSNKDYGKISYKLTKK